MKKLETTVDFYDDLYWAGREYTAENVDQLIEFMHSIGIRKIDWMYDTFWTYYRYPFEGKKNVIAYAAEKAHSMGMELHAIIKPFETGLSEVFVPHTFPKPNGVNVIEDVNGYYYLVDPFTAANPNYRLKRKPGNWDPKGIVKTIKLVSTNDSEISIKAEDLEIWVGEKNGCLEKYEGGFEYSKSIEWRSMFPVGNECRVISLNGLCIDESKKYILVKNTNCNEKGTFCNNIQNMMEIYDEEGNIIPSTPAGSARSIDSVKRLTEYQSIKYCDYTSSEEVKEFLLDPVKVKTALKDSYAYGMKQRDYFGQGENSLHAERVFDRDGYAGVARGKIEYISGAMCPAYTEVQEHWLGLVKECIDSGVDGVNFRVEEHSSKSIERDEYGFNEPVLEKCEERIDRNLVNRINGEAYTAFLQKAKELLKAHGLSIGIHINAEYIYPDDRPAPNYERIPPNIEWEWGKWIKEIADAVYLKTMHFNTEAHADHFIDKITECAKPAIYISTNKDVRFSGNHSRIEYEINKVFEHPRIDGYNLYESGEYTRMNESGQVEGSKEIAQIVRKYFKSN
jgi:hypothetical protein